MSTPFCIKLSPEVHAEIAALAAAQGDSLVTYIADCISARRWIDAQLADGGRILVEPRYGRSMIITLRSSRIEVPT